MDRSDPATSDVAAIWWVRRDLRLQDNRTLLAALDHARSNSGRVAAVFVLDTNILSGLARDDRRMTIIAEGLAELDRDLRERGGGLHLVAGPAEAMIPEFARSCGFPPVFAGGDFEPYGLQRDERVGAFLEQNGSLLEIHHDHMVVAPATVRKGDGSPYRVFTPFHRAWLALLEGGRKSLEPVKSIPVTKEVAPGPIELTTEGILDQAGFRVPARKGPAGGRTAAKERLSRFLSIMAGYGETRDLPGIEGTSRIAMDLRFGFLSAREAAKTATEEGSPGAGKWLSELCWRDFYQEVLRLHPTTVDEPFQQRLARVVWDDPDADPIAGSRWRAWTEGRTGYPFVDAAMRELSATGWMHNRARMVVASFLTKDLHIHWKRGERWFARHLLDIELASNVGGWQWSAGTGTDAQPWFRVFHPVEQSKRWDPSGDWIRRWCPQIKAIPDRWIHEPWKAPAAVLAAAGVRLGQEWPKPVVDHAVERKETLERFGRLARGA